MGVEQRHRRGPGRGTICQQAKLTGIGHPHFFSQTNKLYRGITLKAARMTKQMQGRLLIVDDETELNAALCETLAREGYETVGINSGQLALEALQARDFDVMLTDLMMPGMDGIELLRRGIE